MRSNSNLNRQATNLLGRQTTQDNNYVRNGTASGANYNQNQEFSLVQGSFTDHNQSNAYGAASPFRPQHPSLQPNQSHLQQQQQAGQNLRQDRFYTPARSISGLQMGQRGVTPNNSKKFPVNSIYRNRGTTSKKRTLNDHDSVYYSAVDQSAMLKQTPVQNQPRLGNGNQFGISGQDDQSTNKPRISQTAVRNPTLQAVLLNQSKMRPNEFTGKLDKNHAHLDANFHTPVMTKYQSHLYNDGDQSELQAFDGHAHSSTEFREAFKAVSSKLSEQFQLSDDIRLADIDKQTQSVPYGIMQNTQQTVYGPMTYIPSQHIRLPAAVEEAQQRCVSKQIVEISKRNKVIYFGLGNKLIVWDYTQQSQNASARGAKRNGQQMRQAQNQNHGMALIGSHTFQQQITSIKELASQNVVTGWQEALVGITGCLHVLVATATEIKLILVKKEDNQHAIGVQESLIQSLNQEMPPSIMIEFEKTGRIFYDGIDGNITEIKFQNYNQSLFGNLIYGDRRKLSKTDHQKENFMSKLLPPFLKMRYDKEVVSLKIDEQRNIMYCLGNQISGYAQGQSVIEVFYLGRLGNEFKQLCTIYLWQIVRKLYEDYPQAEVTDKYQLARPFQINYIEPISYSASQVHHLLAVTQNNHRIFLKFQEAEAGIFYQVDVEKMGLQSDLLMTEKLTDQWTISSFVPNFPNDGLLFDDEAISRKVCRSLFQIQNIPSTHYNFQQGQVEHFYVDPAQSMMIYQMGSTQRGQEDPSDCLKVCFLKRNECFYNHLKQQYVEGNGVSQPGCIQENFSVAMIRNDTGNQGFGRGIQLTDQRRHYNQVKETLLKVQACMENADNDVLITLGINKIDRPAWGKHNEIRPYYPSSEVEQQVYLQGNKINLLTDKRLIEISKVRPIDNLMMILIQIARSNRQEIDLFTQEFEDFAESHTMKETCAMLVQVLSDKNASYLISRRVQEIFNLKKRLQIAANRRPVEMHSQMNRSSIRGGSLTRNRLGQQASQANTRNIYGGGRSSIQQSYSLGRGGGFDQETLIEHEELMRGENFVSLLTDFDPDSETECTLLSPTQDVMKAAFDLLITYGDTINVRQMEHLRNIKSEEFENVNSTLADIDLNKLYMYSNKHKALYMYLYRVLQPIWEMNITSQPKLTKIRDLKSNLELMFPVQRKLCGLLEFLTQHQFHLTGRVCQKSELIDQQTHLGSMIEQLCRLDQNEQDFIEVAEKQSCKELKLFVRRCLDVIEFLNLTQTDAPFYMIVNQLDHNMLQQLTDHTFKDMVNAESNPLVRKMLEITVRVTEPGDPSKTSDLINQRSKRAQTLCKTMFSPGENRLFIGESLLQNSLNEVDTDKKEQLMREAMEAFDADPRRVDLAYIIPMLVKNANWTMLVYLSLKKLKLLDITNDTNSIEELYDIIVTLFSMLDRVITNQAQSRKDYEEIDHSVEGQYAKLFLEYLLKVRDVNKHLQLRSKLVQLVYEQQEWRLIGHLFNFFLLKGKDVDFIVKKLDKDVFKKHFESFVNTQSKSECFTREQFFILKRLLEKSRHIEELASLEVKIITDQIVLKKRENDTDVWKDDQLNCQERYDQAKWIKQLLEDVQSNRAYGIAEDVKNKKVAGIGQTGARVEEHINLKKEVDQCLETLEEQLGAIQSAKHKSQTLERAIQDSMRDNKNFDDEDQQLSKLQEFLKMLDQRMVGVRDLTSYYQDFKMLDRKALALLYKSKPIDKQGREQLKMRQMDALKSLAKDICLAEKNEERFQKTIKKQIETLFGKGLDETLKELMFYFAECVAEQYDVDPCQLNEGYSWWLAEILFCHMYMKPSDFIKYIHDSKSAAQSKAEQTHIILLACFRQWIQILTNQVTISQDVRMAALDDLKTNGHDTYNLVLQKYTGTFIRDERLKLDPQLCKQLEELKEKTEKEFGKLLQEHAQHAHVRSQVFAESQASSQHLVQRRPIHEQPYLLNQPAATIAPPQMIHSENNQEQKNKRQVSRDFQRSRNFQADGSFVHSSQHSISPDKSRSERSQQADNSPDEQKKRGPSLVEIKRKRNS